MVNIIQWLSGLWSWQFDSLLWTWRFFNQLTSLSLTPTNSFSITNWTLLVNQIMEVLNNPYFLGILLVLLVVSLFSFSD